MNASLTKEGSRYTLSFERRLAHSPEKVWRVLTERELLKSWFPSDVVGEWTVGAALRFVFLRGEGEGLSEAELSGEVLTVDPPTLLEFRWHENLFRCELVADGPGTRLTFSESFEKGSIAARDAAGWEYCLGAMETVLAGGEPSTFVLADWRVTFEQYAREFEPQAGPQEDPPDTHPDVVAEKAERE